MFVASFIYVCAQENLVQRLYIISMFGYAFIGVKNNWGTGRWEWPRFAKRVSARQVGTGTVCQDEPRWQGGPEAVAWKLSKLRWCWGEAGTEWHPPPPTQNHPLAEAARGHITSCDLLPRARTAPNVHVQVEVAEKQNKSWKTFQWIFITFRCIEGEKLVSRVINWFLDSILLVLRTFYHDHVHINGADGGLREALSFLQQFRDVPGGNPVIRFPSKCH